jgi:hypothetical protein
MMLGHFGNWNPLAALLLFLIAVPAFILFSDRKPKALAIAFGVACIGLCLFLLYLILVLSDRAHVWRGC